MIEAIPRFSVNGLQARQEQKTCWFVMIGRDGASVATGKKSLLEPLAATATEA
jgi:hypothetical protein